MSFPPFYPSRDKIKALVRLKAAARSVWTILKLEGYYYESAEALQTFHPSDPDKLVERIKQVQQTEEYRRLISGQPTEL